MRFYEVFLADSHYHSSHPLTYSSEEKLKLLSIVTVPLQKRLASGFVIHEVDKPDFKTKPIKTLLSNTPLPAHCLKLARWLADYYCTTLSDAMRQFAPTKPTVRRTHPKYDQSITATPAVQIEFDLPLTKNQNTAISGILKVKSTTVLLHGDTGTGKTRVYLELAREVLAGGRSGILLTPEIALTTQLAAAVEQLLPHPTYVLHSQLSDAK